MRRLKADLGQQSGDRMFAPVEQLQDPDAGRVAERLEELRLELVERHW
ncbi:hypothetical protein ACIBKY_52270 [Nonomuraea sp. NPDC050394]